MGFIFRTLAIGTFGGICLFLVGGAAQAQVQRTFVSTSGDDANVSSNCGPNTPCRTFAVAIGVTKAGGEIVPLTSGGYGAVTIAKSLQITTPPGVYAGITVSSGNGITISAAETDTVVLKGLTLNGLGTSDSLINVTSVGTLHVESCEIANSGYRGLSASSTSVGSVFVKDSLARNNHDDGFTFGGSTALVDDTRSEGNRASGFTVQAGTKATLSRIVATVNNDGFFVFSGGELNCDGCIVNNNRLAGFFSLGVARVTRSTVTNNGQEGFFKTSGGSIETFGTNMVRGNNGGGAQTSGTITTVPSL